MREIRFRGKSTLDGKWVYGSYKRFYGYHVSDIHNHICTYDGANIYEVEETTVGQYTGLKDKKGKEIYEGDIIELINEDDYVIRVVCEFGTAKRDIYGNLVEITGFYFKRLYDGRKTFPIVNNYLGKHDLELFEVIGNIYENPELLEVSNES